MKLSFIFSGKPRLFMVAALTSALAACGGGGSSNTATTGTPPSVILTIPATTNPIVTGVATNLGLTAKFNQDMLASSINTSSMKVSCPSGTPISGTVTVTYDAVNRLAVLQHATALPASTTCEATITTAAKNSAGLGLTANYVWSFTTGTGADTTAPTITGISPLASATVVCLSKDVVVTFSEPMDPTTINSTTFTVRNNTTSALVSGLVTYDAISNAATFAVTNPPGFDPSTTFTRVITTGATDLAGNPIASNNTATFTTGTQICTPSAAVNLRTIAAYGGFGGGAGATNQGINTIVTGDLGTTAECTLFTGFHTTTNIYTETGSNIGLVTGNVYCGPSAPGSVGDLAIATQAASDATIAYAALAAQTPSIAQTDQLGGLTLPPGIYKSTAQFLVTTGNLTLDAGGDANAVWVFQVPSQLTVGLVATPRSVLLTNGALAKNVYWQVGSAARIEDGSTMVGTIIAQAGVTISTAGQTIQTTLIGRAIGLAASVTMVNTTVTVPN